MNILAIESSAKVASAALLKDEDIICEIALNTKLTHSTTLMPMIDRLLNMSDTDISEIDMVAVSAGPGSFTGLRIGAASAKGLAFALDKPVVPVPTLEALAYNLSMSDTLICPIMDARRSQTYTGLYRCKGEDLEIVLPGCAIGIEEIIEKINDLDEPVVFLGDGIPAFKDVIEDKCKIKFSFAPPHRRLQRASSLAALARIYAINGKTTSADDFRPDYLRRSQAERERMEKLSFDIREAKKEDAFQIEKIASQSKDTAWSHEDFIGSIESKQALVLVAFEKDKDDILGYLVINYAGDEAEIPSVAVREDSRQKGYGRTLLAKASKAVSELGVNSIFLEVRESNEAARALYASHGFKESGRRKGFYKEPLEDALILHYDIRL